MEKKPSSKTPGRLWTLLKFKKTVKNTNERKCTPILKLWTYFASDEVLDNILITDETNWSKFDASWPDLGNEQGDEVFFWFCGFFSHRIVFYLCQLSVCCESITKNVHLFVHIPGLQYSQSVQSALNKGWVLCWCCWSVSVWSWHPIREERCGLQ